MPSVFDVFELPATQRLPALRAHLDAGVDPNIVDKAWHPGESLLGRAFSHDKTKVDPDLVQALLDAGANPLESRVWVQWTGRPEPLFPRTVSSAWGRIHFKDNPITPPLVESILQACLVHAHVFNDGLDCLGFMLGSLRPTPAFAHAIGCALAMGFPVDQPVEDQPNAVHYLVNAYRRSTGQVSVLPPFEAAWEVVSCFIAAGVDMTQVNSAGQSGWEAIDACAGLCVGSAVYQAIQCDRQARALQSTTPTSPRAALVRRV